jgi:nucleoside-diphosphate-sugar epimerase
MRVVVVGGSGNVGTAVIERLRQAPEVTEIVGVSRRPPNTGGGPYAGLRWHAVDVGAPEAVERLTPAFAGADAVILLAWLLQPNRDEATMWRTNVTGTRHVLDAAAAAGVTQVDCASSVGAYSAAPKSIRVDETWPTGGVHTSHYAREKAAMERVLDAFEVRHPGVILTRLRPGLVMQAPAAEGIRRLFLGRWFPTGWITRVRVPIVPLPSTTIAQVVHASDLADAFWRSLERRAGGAFNIAAEPVVTPELVASLLGGRHVPFRAGATRRLLWAAWKLRLVAMDPGWIDLATNIPVLSTERARRVLGWSPRVDARAALAEMLEAVSRHDSIDQSPPLARGGTSTP